MLTIENIDKAIGMVCYDREIYHITTSTNKIGEQSYVFEFDSIEDGQVPTGYNKPKQIHLVRNEHNGTYRLFCMGLQVATERRVSLSEVKCLRTLLLEISQVLKTTRHWWGNANIKN